ncbi:MAG: arginine deiminase [Bacteroidales bacterium]|jgi:arginine deiminase|nr:arginine deiminase [Bacteroidales bacterium]
MDINLYSEIGKLNGVILHTPGKEIEQMTPDTIEEALYSDLLNMDVAQKEYFLFSEVLKRWTTTYQVKDLLTQTLQDENAKKDLVSRIVFSERCLLLFEPLMNMSADELATILIEGLTYDEASFIKSKPKERYILRPLYNLFFTRDASSSMYDRVLINAMKSKVRERETLIMDAIFQNIFSSQTINPLSYSADARTEGGDVLIAKDDVLFLGCGLRTNKQGVEFLADYFAKTLKHQHIIVQDLPHSPESFIHLDMVFTMLDRDKCMIYEPLLKEPSLQTWHIEIDKGHISYNEKDNFLAATKDVGFDLQPVFCGGDDLWHQQREQWHSGANFFCLAEGKIIGYARNTNTIEALNQAGFDIIDAKDVIKGREDMLKHNKFAVIFDAAELPRGGGGARCMTMPINRDKVDW